MNGFTRLSFVPAALLLLMLCAAAVEAQEAKGVQGQRITCRPCQAAQDRCMVGCLGRDDNQVRSCLLGCDNAAALCSCDEPVTLSSEEYVAANQGLKLVTAFSEACHSTTPCGPEYGSCAGWSSVYDCGDQYCGYAVGCGLCNEWQCEYGGPALRQDVERYRVCFDQFANACTEYQRSSSNYGCGC